MNILKFFPKKLRKDYQKNIINTGTDKAPAIYYNRIFIASIITTLIFSTLFYFIDASMLYSILVFVCFQIFFYFKVSLSASARIKKMEEVFPDVISLMASNLRSGITIEKAFLLAARPEFAPLDKEILKTGKEITTGQDVILALNKMSEKISSEKIEKVVTLIISGLKAGGNISDLLDQTSRNMKEKEVIEKKSRSTILMYVIFIFFAVGVGAPVLFGLSSILVEIVLNLTSNLPAVDSTQTALPFSFSELSISLNFVIYFAIIFIIVTNFISCLVIGLVNKGEGKAGLKLFIPLLALSLGLFFIVRVVLSKLLVNALTFI